MLSTLHISLKSPCLWASFHPLTPLFVVSIKENLLNLHYEMLNLSIECTRFEWNYSSCTCRSNENLCSDSRAAQEQKKDRVVFWVWPRPWMLIYLFAGSFSISPCVWPNSGYWWCLFLILQISLSFEGLFLNQNGSYAIVGSGLVV